jgi:hypothetical protein
MRSRLASLLTSCAEMGCWCTLRGVQLGRVPGSCFDSSSRFSYAAFTVQEVRRRLAPMHTSVCLSTAACVRGAPQLAWRLAIFTRRLVELTPPQRCRTLGFLEGLAHR